ncbi:MAG: UTP--glucose-1-phosphate uridylyltransferase [Methylacidiphilales bacterium]|nr:UTP--glucose-1-phosphate uridylyltransferase [Candidatus Methylacidiphilales bacterium]
MSQSIVVKKALFPVAGFGTRFLPATKATPKEMLPIIDKPLVQYAVEEAYLAGIREFIFITGRSKRAIEDHFDDQLELELELDRTGKIDLLEKLRATIPKDSHFIYTRQSKPKGLGDAILTARALISPDEYFAVLLADDYLLHNKRIQNTLTSMVSIVNDHPGMVIATEQIAIEDSRKYGMVSGKNLGDRLLNCELVVEKPEPKDSPSTQAIIGRYILHGKLFEFLQGAKPGSQGEIQLTDAIAHMIQKKVMPVTAFDIAAQRFDCGSKLGYLQATFSTALEDPSLKAGIIALINNNKVLN